MPNKHTDSDILNLGVPNQNMTEYTMPEGNVYEKIEDEDGNSYFKPKKTEKPKVKASEKDWKRYNDSLTPESEKSQMSEVFDFSEFTSKTAPADKKNRWKSEEEHQDKLKQKEAREEGKTQVTDKAETYILDNPGMSEEKKKYLRDKAIEAAKKGATANTFNVGVLSDNFDSAAGGSKPVTEEQKASLVKSQEKMDEATATNDKASYEEAQTEVANTMETPKIDEAPTEETLPTMSEEQKAVAQSIGWNGDPKTISKETEEAANSIIDETPPDQQKEMAEGKLGGWDKLAVALTVASFALAALTGGAIPPVPFTALAGTNERISNLNKLNKDRQAYNEMVRNWNEMTPEQKARYSSFEDYAKKQSSLMGQVARNVTEEGGSESNATEQALTTQERDIAGKLQLLNAQGEVDMIKLKEQLSAHWEEVKATLGNNLEIQKLMAANNKDLANTAAWGGAAKTALSALGTVLGTALAGPAGGVAGGAAGSVAATALTNSDYNKKMTKHTYIPKEKRR